MSDRKLGVYSGGSLTIGDSTYAAASYYEPHMVSAADYYAFGMVSRQISNVNGKENYRFGFNGQEMSNEIKGFGNSYTAEFWEYDSRIGRRWNPDPVYKHSPYEAFGGNPISFADPYGADTINITRTTTRRQFGSMGGGLDGIAPIKALDRVTKAYDIAIVGAKGNDVFKIIDVDVTIDENGKETKVVTPTTLELNSAQSFYRYGGHNMKGYIDDRYALAANAPDWLLKSYADKSGDIGVRSALAYQKDVPFAAALNKITNVAYTVSGAYGVFRFAVSKMAFQAALKAAPDGSVYSVGFEMKLSSNLYPGGSYYSHFKAANTALDKAMVADANFASQMRALGITVPKSSRGTILGKSPADWVWHHSTETGIMQLVPKGQHPSIPGGIFWETMHPGGVGGMSTWNK